MRKMKIKYTQNIIKIKLKELKEKCKTNLTYSIKMIKKELIEILIVKLTLMKNSENDGMDEENYLNDTDKKLIEMDIIKKSLKSDDTKSEVDTGNLLENESKYQIQGVRKFGYVNLLLNKNALQLGKHYITLRKIKDKLKYAMHNIIYIKPAHLKKQNIYEREQRDNLSFIESTYITLIKVRLKFIFLLLRDFESTKINKLPLLYLDKLTSLEIKFEKKINNKKKLEIFNILPKQYYITKLGKYFKFVGNVSYIKTNILNFPCYRRYNKKSPEEENCNQSDSKTFTANLNSNYVKLSKLTLFSNRYLNIKNVYNSAIVNLTSYLKEIDNKTMPAKTGLNASNAKLQLVTTVSAKSKRSESAERDNYVDDEVLSEETKKKSRKSTSVSALNTKVMVLIMVLMIKWQPRLMTIQLLKKQLDHT